MARLHGTKFSAFIQVSQHHLHMGESKEGSRKSGKFVIMGEPGGASKNLAFIVRTIHGFSFEG